MSSDAPSFPHMLFTIFVPNKKKCPISVVLRKSWMIMAQIWFQKIHSWWFHSSSLLLSYFDLFWFFLVSPIHIRLGPCRQLLGSNLRHLRRMPAITSDVKSVFMSRQFTFLLCLQISAVMNSCAVSDIAGKTSRVSSSKSPLLYPLEHLL